MRVFKNLLTILLSIGITTGAIHARDPGDVSKYDEELNEQDWDGLKRYLQTKTVMDVMEKATHMSISGDIRTEWRHMNESRDGERLRGPHAIKKNGDPVSRNDFDMEFNLQFNVNYDRTWAVAKLRYDNTAGVDRYFRPCDRDPEAFNGSGFCGDLCLRKAYMGYNVYKGCGTVFDIELGRRRLSDVFESEVQFLSRFDGILFKYSTDLEAIGRVYWNTGGFIIDERTNYFGGVTEIGALNIADTGFEMKYSFIWWPQYSKNRCEVSNPRGFRYQVSQIGLAYNFIAPSLCCEPGQLYGAFLYNHDTRSSQRNGWYIGLTVGEVVEEGDWAFDLQYQWVEAFVIPDMDASGIGRGNVQDESITNLDQRRGNTNFKGWKAEFLYALTDNITLDAILEASRQIDSHIGGRHRYSKFELEAIYAF